MDITHSDDEKFMMEAIAEARGAAREGNWPIGSVIVLDGKIISRAHNRGKTSGNIFAHAELIALQTVSELLDSNRDKAILYTTFQPCPMCFGAIVLSKIRRVVWGVDVNNSGALSMVSSLPPFYKDPKFSFEAVGGVCEQECKDVFLSTDLGKMHSNT